MKTKIALQSLLYMFFLIACGGVTPYPTLSATSPTIAVSATKQLLTLTPMFWNTSTPETLYGYPTPQPVVLPTCNPIDCFKMEDNVQRQDFSFHDLYLGEYVLRNWCNNDPKFTLYPYCAVTISSKSNQQIEIWGYPAKLGVETGADLTGNGKPNIVIINWSGGNCCVDTIVYEVGDSLEKIMDISSFRPGTFIDLNQDETYEYIAPYRNFSLFCTDCQLRVSIVYEYQPNLGYVPATYKFKDVLSTDMQWATDFIAQFTKQNPNMPLHFLSTNYYENPSDEDKEYLKFDKENPDYFRASNALYELIAYYLLAGQQVDAQITLNTYFSPEKETEYLLAIQQDLHGLLAP